VTDVLKVAGTVQINAINAQAVVAAGEKRLTPNTLELTYSLMIVKPRLLLFRRIWNKLII
jgi:hypothetical protein